MNRIPLFFAACIVTVCAPCPSFALEGLAGLQKAASNHCVNECMVHEYARRYNEVLRQYSKEHKSLSSDMEEHAHQEAMQWVMDVWKYADQSAAHGVLESWEFKSSVDAFRLNQHQQYPHLNVVP